MKKVIIVILCFSVGILAAEPCLTGVKPENGIYLRLSYGNSRTFQEELHNFSRNGSYDIIGVDLQDLKMDLFLLESDCPGFFSKAVIENLGDFETMREIGADQQFIDPDELSQTMYRFASDYPLVAHLISIGQTEEDRDILAIRISDNPALDEDEPALVFNGQHHAREVMCSEVCVDMIEFLCSRYGSDPRVTKWVDSLEIWVIPIVNPDGVNFVFTEDALWRKDRHDNGSGIFGIDPNRNYPAFWGSCDGSSGNPDSDLYRGAYPGESGCVSLMMSFAEEVRPVIDLSYHTCSELVIYPFGCDGEICSEHEMVSAIGTGLASVLECDNGNMGYFTGTSWQILYPADGTDIDWYYSKQGTVPFVVEINNLKQGFYPSYTRWRDATVERMRPGWQYLLDRVTGPSVTGLITDGCTGTPLVATCWFQEYPPGPDDTPVTTDIYGRYTKLALPGQYSLVITAPGYFPLEHPVTISGSQVNLDIPLVPEGSYGLYEFSHIIADTGGDDDGVLDPGETVTIEVILLSMGNTTNVQADMTTDDPYITIENGHADFGNIPDGGTGSSQSPHFILSLDPESPVERIVAFDIRMNADQLLCAGSGLITEKITNCVNECPILYELMDNDPGFAIDNTGDGGWEYGVPQSGPGTPHTGLSCYGTNLAGPYGNNVNYNLTWGPIDCSAIFETQLIFWKWLQSEFGFDTGYVQVSADNSDWTTIWAGYGSDTTWTEVIYDISEIADAKPQIWIRWRFASNSFEVADGFFIDDVSICGKTLPEGVPRLKYNCHSIDDSTGNADEEINAGEIVSIALTLGNSGTDATGVSAILSTTNPHVTISSATALFPDIPQNSRAASLTDYVFSISPEALNGELIDLRIDWFTNEFSGVTLFEELVRAPVLKQATYRILDSVSGDGDGILDPGETAQLEIWLMNEGTGIAHHVETIINSDHPEYITIDDDRAGFPDIEPGITRVNNLPNFSVTMSSSIPEHTSIVFNMDICADNYSAMDSFHIGVRDASFSRRYLRDMEADPGWTVEGQWSWGIPTGSSGDPASAFSGTHIYGFNLEGSYSNSLPEFFLTTDAIDCSGLTNMEVRFRRWLGVENSVKDHAYLRISSDGKIWTSLWRHSGCSVTDTAWIPVKYEIPSIFDDKPEVFLRWVMGMSDTANAYCGWNIDDIEIWAEDSIEPTPTQSPTVVTPTPEPDCTNLGCTIIMPSSYFGPGDPCFCDVKICNPTVETMPQIPVFVILDVYGNLYYAPSFGQFDHYTRDIPPGLSTLQVLQQFSWPSGVGSATGLFWYAAMTDQQISSVIGDVGSFEFGWHQ